CRLTEAERVADRDDEVADVEVVRVAELELAQVARFDSEQGNVGRRIAADDLGFELAPVGQRDDDRFGVLHDVAVRHDQTFVGVDDDARADALLRHRLLKLLRKLEEPAKERVLEKRALLRLWRERRDGNVDNGRGDSLEQRCVGRILVLVDERPRGRYGIYGRCSDGDEPRPYGPAGPFHLESPLTQWGVGRGSKMRATNVDAGTPRDCSAHVRRDRSDSANPRAKVWERSRSTRRPRRARACSIGLLARGNPRGSRVAAGAG